MGASADGTQLLIVAERDGDTVSPRARRLPDGPAHRRSRRRASGRGCRNLEDRDARCAPTGTRLFAPIAAEPSGRVAGRVGRRAIYGYEKALFDFDSKHITRPGNKLASEYLFNTYTSFGYDAASISGSSRAARSAARPPTSSRR